MGVGVPDLKYNFSPPLRGWWIAARRRGSASLRSSFPPSMRVGKSLVACTPSSPAGAPHESWSPRLKSFSHSDWGHRLHRVVRARLTARVALFSPWSPAHAPHGSWSTRLRVLSRPTRHVILHRAAEALPAAGLAAGVPHGRWSPRPSWDPWLLCATPPKGSLAESQFN